MPSPFFRVLVVHPGGSHGYVKIRRSSGQWAELDHGLTICEATGLSISVGPFGDKRVFTIYYSDSDSSPAKVNEYGTVLLGKIISPSRNRKVLGKIAVCRYEADGPANCSWDDFVDMLRQETKPAPKGWLVGVAVAAAAAVMYLLNP
jgi:hypothetical protein